MSTSTLKYYVEVDKYLFEDEISFLLEEGNIKSVRINISKESKPLYALFIEFSLGYVNSLEEAEEVVRPSLHNILIELSVKYRMYVGNAYLSSYTIVNEGGAILVSSVEVRRPLDDLLENEKKTELKNALKGIVETPESTSDVNGKKLLRLALSNRDITAKYMLLYQALLYVTRDNQNKENQTLVDNFIKNFEGETKSEYKDGPIIRNGNPVKETVYTRLRNEIGHYRGVDFNNTKKEMERTIDSLLDIVRNAVLRN